MGTLSELDIGPSDREREVEEDSVSEGSEESEGRVLGATVDILGSTWSSMAGCLYLAVAGETRTEAQSV